MAKSKTKQEMRHEKRRRKLEPWKSESGNYSKPPKGFGDFLGMGFLVPLFSKFGRRK